MSGVQEGAEGFTSYQGGQEESLCPVDSCPHDGLGEE